MVTDDWADKKEAKENYNINLLDLNKIKNMDSIIVAVAHDKYINLELKELCQMLKPNSLIVDVKSIYDSRIFKEAKLKYWRL